MHEEEHTHARVGGDGAWDAVGLVPTGTRVGSGEKPRLQCSQGLRLLTSKCGVNTQQTGARQPIDNDVELAPM